MKKFTIFASILALAVSCTVNKVETEPTHAPVFYAYTESNAMQTKTSISVDAEGTGTIWWKPADKINVFFGTTSVPYVSTNTEEATTVVFETTAMIGSTEGGSSIKWGLYPYDSAATCDGSSVTTTVPAGQKCIPSSFGDNLFPMVATSSTNDLHFLNVCGGIKFSLSRDDIESITFRGNNDEDIAGTVRISLGEDGKPVGKIVSGHKIITLTPQSGTVFAKDTYYYIVMLPSALSGGFTITFETATQTGTFNFTDKPVEIKRSIFGKKTDIDSYVSEWVDKKPIVDDSVIDESHYITYVANKDSFDSGDDYYSLSSYVSNPVPRTEIGAIELKFQLSYFPQSDTKFLICGNYAKDDYDELGIGSYNTGVFMRCTNGSFLLSDYGLTQTSLMTVTLSSITQKATVNGISVPYFYGADKVFDYNASYFFTYYYRERDEGVLESFKGIPDGSKMYYIKIWDTNGSLVYIGYASKSINPATDTIEYCWASNYKGNESYEFSHRSSRISAQSYGGNF